MNDLIETYLKDRDEKTFELILDRYMPLVYKLTRNFKAKHFYEDLLNTGRLAIWEAIDGYDSKRGSFFTYVYKMIDVKIKKELESIQGFNYHYYASIGIKPLFLSLDDQDNKITLEAPGTGKSISDIDFFDLLDKLSADNKDLLVNYYYTGLTVEEMADKYGVSNQSIFRKLTSARNKLKSIYEKNQ